jgi:hypothetical protein
VLPQHVSRTRCLGGTGPSPQCAVGGGGGGTMTGAAAPTAGPGGGGWPSALPSTSMGWGSWPEWPLGPGPKAHAAAKAMTTADDEGRLPAGQRLHGPSAGRPGAKKLEHAESGAGLLLATAGVAALAAGGEALLLCCCCRCRCR